MAKTIIEGARIVNEGKIFTGHLVVDGERIAALGPGPAPESAGAERVDARGLLLLPGVIDDQVHFREPGLTAKGDIRSESAAAAAGGVTSFMEMPNTVPATTTLELWEQKCALGAEHSAVGHSFYLGATNDNLDQIRRIDPRRVPGVKVFMGSSTGRMLVDDPDALAAVFAESPVPVATHCEDEAIVRRNLAHYKGLYGEAIPPECHPLIRSEEACYVSTAKAVELAERYGTELHVLHLSTARELTLFAPGPVAGKRITAEVCVHHLWFDERDYARLGNRIKWNPAIKTPADRGALLEAVASGRLDVVATDHAPHTVEEKARPYLECPSGGPLVQHSLVAMLELHRRGEVTLEHIVERMCHAPSRRYRVKERGFLRPGYYADLVLVDPGRPQTVAPENLRYKCGWSPFEGQTFSARVVRTCVNGHPVYREGIVDENFRGKALEFDR